MPKSKLVLSIAVIAVIASLAVLLVIQRQSGVKQREEINSLPQQLDQLPLREKENERLSNDVARAGTSPTKGQSNELQTPHAENTPTQAGLAATNNPPPAPPLIKSGLVPLPSVPSVPKESWTLTGYETPEAGFQSSIWAASKGDVKAVLSGMSPNERARMEREFDGKSESDIAKVLSDNTGNITGFRVASRQEISDKEIVLDIYIDGPNAWQKMKFIKIGNEWKMDGNLDNDEAPKP